MTENCSFSMIFSSYKTLLVGGKLVSTGRQFFKLNLSQDGQTNQTKSSSQPAHEPCCTPLLKQASLGLALLYTNYYKINMCMSYLRKSLPLNLGCTSTQQQVTCYYRNQTWQTKTLIYLQNCNTPKHICGDNFRNKFSSSPKCIFISFSWIH